MMKTRKKINGLGLLALAAIMYAGLSIVGESPNPIRWGEPFERRVRERQAYYKLYNQAYNQAIKCVEKDGIDGLNLSELADLYSRAGINVNYDLRAALPQLPTPTMENLERVIKSCEVKKK